MEKLDLSNSVDNIHSNKPGSNVNKKVWESPQLAQLQVKETKKNDWYTEDHTWNNLKSIP